MKRTYEITYILPVNLGEDVQKATEERVKGWITGSGGEIKNASHWGRRSLAYNIKTNRDGYYIFIESEMEPSSLTDFDRRMSLENNVLRHLVVRVDD
jgi:small subunit ribosomal protein S6